MVYEPLLRAVARGASLDEVQGLLDEAPEEESRGKALFDVIERALRLRAGVDVLHFLIQQDPTCAHEFGGDSLLLHLACYYRAPYEIIKLLLQLNPGAIHIAGNAGDLPLHCLFYDYTEVGLSMDVLKLIVSKFPDAAQMTNAEGEIPLHIACQYGARAETVQFLVFCYPVGRWKRDNDGIMPIHHARTGKNASAQVVNVLLNEYPEGARAKGQFGQVPLHIACGHQNWEVARLLVRAYPDGTRALDDKGLLAIHWACYQAAPLDIIRMLIDTYPECVCVPASASFSGPLALHEACSGRAPHDVLQLLLEVYPDAIHVANRFGRLPLHCACCNYCNLDQIRILVQADPLTLLQKTHRGKTPLELAYDNRHATEETKSFLLEKQQEVVQSHYDAVVFVVGMCLNAVDNNNNFPELVFARIWQFAQPDVWYPSHNNDE